VYRAFLCLFVGALKGKQLELSTLAINIVHGRPSTCIDPELKKSRTYISYRVIKYAACVACRSIRLYTLLIEYIFYAKSKYLFYKQQKWRLVVFGDLKE